MKWTEFKDAVKRAAFHADRVLGKADGLAQVVALAAAARSPLAFVGVAIAGARFLAGALDQGVTAKAWHTPPIPAALLGTLAEALGLVPGTDDRDRTTVAGVTVVAFNHGNMSDRLCIQAEHDAPGLHAALMEALSRHVRAVSTHVQLGGTSERLQFIPAEMPDDPDSEVAEAVWARQAGFLRAGKPRCVMLVGPPRSGKSTIARVLARRVAEEWPGATSMRVPVADLGDLRASTVDEVLACVRPDVVIVDDLERAQENGLLDLLERCHGRQRLVVVTCNDPKKLSPAVRGPGRVDDVWVVAGAGEALAGRVLADTRPDLAARVSHWPVKYVAELADRIRHVPGVDVDAELVELEARVEEAVGS